MKTLSAPKPLADLLGTRVRVYRNLTEKCWSVQYREAHVRKDSGRASYRWQVAGHAGAVVLEDVHFEVSGPVWERLRRGGPKEVHAYAIGWLKGATPVEDPIATGGGVVDYLHACATRVTYNPRTAAGPHFSIAGGKGVGSAVFQADHAFGNPAGHLFIDRRLP